MPDDVSKVESEDDFSFSWTRLLVVLRLRLFVVAYVEETVVSGAAATLVLIVLNEVHFVARRCPYVYRPGCVVEGVLVWYRNGVVVLRAASSGKCCRLPGVGRGLIRSVCVTISVTRVSVGVIRSSVVCCVGGVRFVVDVVNEYLLDVGVLVLVDGTSS